MIRHWVVIPAAGSGRRMGADTPKQYLELCGRTVIEHTLAVFLDSPLVDGIVVAVAADDRYWPQLARHYAADRVVTVPGGAERSDSVLNALQALSGRAQENDWVLVHDAARPCLHPDDLARLVATLDTDATGGLLAVPVADTLKQVNEDLLVIDTRSRQQLWHALTPQMFRLGALRDALARAAAARDAVTDDAAAMELAGYTPRIVPGRRDNIKITVASDLELAASCIRARSEQ